MPLTAEQRKAIEWVLSVGGGVDQAVGNQVVTLQPGQKVPDGPFRAIGVGLRTLKTVDDAVLDNLRSFPPGVVRLYLENTAVTDVGLLKLIAMPGFRGLTTLDVRGTKVTEVGVRKLAAALPQCKIEWDGGLIEPKAK